MMEIGPYHLEANKWLRSRGWLSRRDDEPWRDLIADDWKWLDVPEGYQPTTIILTGEAFQVDYACSIKEILKGQTYSDTFVL